MTYNPYISIERDMILFITKRILKLKNKLQIEINQAIAEFDLSDNKLVLLINNPWCLGYVHQLF